MPNKKINATPELIKLIQEFCESNRDIVLVSLCTTDGFPIHYYSSDASINEVDKLAAISSTFSALSNSSARQMNQGQCEFTIIEATSGNILFVSASYLNTPCALAIVANTKMALATARYKTKNIAHTISQVQPSLFEPLYQ